MKHVVAIAAVISLGSSAFAEPLGTPLTMQVSHSGPFGEIQNFVHTYGGSNQVFDSFGFSYMVVSAGNAPGWHNSIRLDFSAFGYTDFAGEIGTVNITGFTQPIINASFLDSNFAAIPSAASGPFLIVGSWNVDDVLATGAPVMYIAWNKIPSPGGAALLGLAGLVGLRRRR